MSEQSTAEATPSGRGGSYTVKLPDGKIVAFTPVQWNLICEALMENAGEHLSSGTEEEQEAYNRFIALQPQKVTN